MANREVIESWVTALESGKYEQTKGVLRDDDGFCCLGVLTELAVEAGVIAPAGRDESGYFYESADGIRYRALPSGTVQEWVGLDEGLRVIATVEDEDYDSDTGEDIPATRPFELTTLNDDHGFSFNQIAAALRAEYLNGKGQRLMNYDPIFEDELDFNYAPGEEEFIKHGVQTMNLLTDNDPDLAIVLFAALYTAALSEFVGKNFTYNGGGE